MEKLVDRFRLLAPDNGDDRLAEELIHQAGDWICAYTGREEVPQGLLSAQVRLAVVYFNRMGMEGESRRNEGDVLRVTEAVPDDIRREAARFRLARTVSACG